MKNPKERIQRVQAMLAAFHSNAEIRAQLVEEFGISERQAYLDIEKAQECSFHSEERKRMHLGVIESMVERYRIAMARTRTVTCPECQHESAVERAPNLKAADQVVTSMVKAFRLEITPEELLGNEALAEKVAQFTIANLHVWSDDSLERLEAQLRVIRQQRASEAGQ